MGQVVDNILNIIVTYLHCDHDTSVMLEMSLFLEMPTEEFGDKAACFYNFP